MGRNFTAYAVHKYMYPATYNFRDEADGTSGTDIGFITSYGSTDSNASASIIASEDGHNKVLKLIEDGDNGTQTYFIHAGENQSGALTFEVWAKYIDHGQGYCYIQLRDSGGTAMVSILINSADNKVYIYYGNGAGGNSNVSTTIASDTWFHLRSQVDTDADTQSAWINGVNKISGQPLVSDRTTTNIDQVYVFQSNGGGANALESYFDAFGFSWDADYAIGDNCHWRHYKESADDFEGDDVGTQGTSITWVDVVDTAASFEIVPEFGVHKKVLRAYYSSGAGGYDVCTHDFSSQAKTGWWAGWVKASDATDVTVVALFESAVGNIVEFRISTDKIQYYDGNLASWEDAQAIYDATWYFIYIQWYDAANDYFDLWIDNILIASSIQCTANQTSGINGVSVNPYAAGSYFYLDAPISSLDSDTRGDNRTFDYHSTYTKEDITSTVINATQSNALHGERKASLFSTTEYIQTSVFLQLYDITGKLGGEFEIKSSTFNGAYHTHLLRDANADELGDPLTESFSAATINDNTDSTCMLKTALPNVGAEDGRLLLVNADAESATYSPTTQNYPRNLFLRDIANLANSVEIVDADGTTDLDSDKSCGDTIDVSSDQGYFYHVPIVTSIQEGINYFDVYGAIDPATGTRFHKNIDNSSGATKRSWSITNNNLLSQTDVDNFATAVSTRIVDIVTIQLFMVGLQTHSMGEILNLTYSDDTYSVSATDFYIVSETYNYDRARSEIVLSEGLIEDSDYASKFERAEAETNQYASQIYNSDLVTVVLSLFPDASTTANVSAYGVDLPAKLDSCYGWFYLDDSFDDSRSVVAHFVFRNGTAGSRTTDGLIGVIRRDTDGSAGSSTILAPTSFPAVFTAGSGHYHASQEITSSDLVAGNVYEIYYLNNETDNGNATDIKVDVIQIRYYIKRSS